MSSDAEVEALLADHTDSVAATARRLRTVLLDGHPRLEERVRRGWHSINYHDRAAGYVCGIFPLADRVQLIFEQGARLPDAQGRLSGTGSQVRAMEFATESDVDPAVVLEYLDLAVELGTGRRTR